MSHTYTNLLSHVVFGTEGRLPLIKNEMRQELFAYLGGLVKGKGGKPIIINGVDDHVHLLIELPPNMHLSDSIQFVKANSSRWTKERFGIKFSWQRGFGAFSVSRSNVGTVARYIRDQEIHHKKFDFTAEFVSLLNKNGVGYDERYLWK